MSWSFCYDEVIKSNISFPARVVSSSCNGLYIVSSLVLFDVGSDVIFSSDYPSTVVSKFLS